MPVVKVRDVLRKLRAEGWRQTGHEGSHRQFEHPSKPGKVTISGGANDDIHPKTWNNIQKQAGWK